MRRRYRILTVGYGLFIAAAPLMALHSSAHAQSAEQVLCDRIAADPADPDKPGDVSGVLNIQATDIPLALKYCRLASPRSRRAMYELGRTYAANNQMPQAESAYRKAAAAGSTAAMVALGILYDGGSGAGKDPAQARALFQRAATAGNALAVARLAALDQRAGQSMNPVQERALLTNAAAANSADAQFQLGLMYANGVGGPKDDVAARSLFEKAAAQGNVDALDWMGSFAANGRGGPRDVGAAKSYYGKAAALGNEDAKAQLKLLDCSLIMKDSRGHVVGCM